MEWYLESNLATQDQLQCCSDAVVTAERAAGTSGTIVLSSVYLRLCTEVPTAFALLAAVPHLIVWLSVSQGCDAVGSGSRVGRARPSPGRAVKLHLRLGASHRQRRKSSF